MAERNVSPKTNEGSSLGTALKNWLKLWVKSIFVSGNITDGTNDISVQDIQDAIDISASDGDMTKAIYDTDDDGIVDAAEVLNDGSSGGGNEVTAAEARTHIDDTDNPHSVDKTDVGLSSVPNLDTTDAVNNEHVQNSDTDLDATFEATFVKKVDTVNVLSDITSAGTDIEDAVTKKHTHTNKTELDKVSDGDHDVRTDNPHAVTKAQVGLTNVDDVQQMPLSYLDTDTTLAANSDLKVPSQKAIKAYSDALIAAADAMTYKGVIDCSGNPNYPAGDAGDTYRISVAGKIGGASGVNVEVGDMPICVADSTASGDQVTVGAFWNIIQVNIDGNIVGTSPYSSTDDNLAMFNGTSGKVIEDSGLARADVTGHIADTANPHSVVADQVGTDDSGVNVQEAIDALEASAYEQNTQLVRVGADGADYTTITLALAAILDATTDNRYAILVYPGTYDEQVTMKEYVDIIGVDRHLCFLTSSSNGTVISANNSKLKNFDITNAATDSIIKIIMLANTAKSFEVDNCYIHETASGKSIHGFSDASATTRNLIIKNSKISLANTSASSDVIYGFLNISGLDMENCTVSLFGTDNGLSAFLLKAGAQTIKNSYIELTFGGNANNKCIFADTGAACELIGCTLNNETGFGLELYSASGSTIELSGCGRLSDEGDTEAGTITYSTIPLSNTTTVQSKVTELDNHIADVANPHSVEADQVATEDSGINVQEALNAIETDVTALQKSSIAFVIDGGGSAITTGIKGDLAVPFAGTITGVTMLANETGSIVVDLWVDSYANYPATDADTITSSAVPTITTALKSQDLTLTGWTTAISEDTIIRFNVDSITDIQRVTIILEITRT